VSGQLHAPVTDNIGYQYGARTEFDSVYVGKIKGKRGKFFPVLN